MLPPHPTLSPIFSIRSVLHLSSLQRNVIPKHRLNSSSTTSTTANPRITPQASPPPPSPPKQHRSLFPYIWGTTFILIGLTAGHVARSFVAPPLFPEPESREDRFRLEVLRHDIDSLNVVKALRAEGYHLHSDIALGELSKGKTGWRELEIPLLISNTLDSKPESDFQTTGNGTTPGGEFTRALTQKTMAGSGGLGIQRAFWNPITRELIAVVYFGGRLSGWPGLAHGGAIATVFEDGFLRVVAGPDTALESVPSPSSLSLTYARPTQANNFYILRALMSSRSDEATLPPQPEPNATRSWLPWRTDFTKRQPMQSSIDTVVEVSGTIENLSGQVCVRASATFPASVLQR